MHVSRHASGPALLGAHAPFFAGMSPGREFLRGLAADRTEPLAPPLGFIAVHAGASPDDAVAAVAARTVPHAVAVTDIEVGSVAGRADATEVAETVVASLLHPAVGPPAERLFGCDASVTEFEAILTGRGCTVRTEMRFCFLALAELVDPRVGPGAMEQLTLADADAVTTWAEGFAHETGVPGGFASAEVLRRRLEQGRIVGWRHDGALVAVAQTSRTTPSTMTISFVWTPPEHRRLGYASRLVAALSREILAADRHPVLFTDAANPVSNRIYEGLGFQARESYRSIAIE